MTTEQLISHYERLDEVGRQQIEQQLFRLLSQKPLDREEYRQQLLQGSVWTEEDVQSIRQAREQLTDWRNLTW